MIPLSDLGERLGRRIPYATVRGWHVNGRVNRHTRKRVKLGAMRMTYGLATSVEEYWRFIEKLDQE